MMGQRGRSDEEVVMFFKVFPCNKGFNHDFAACFDTHPGDKARRRCLLQHSYSSKMCPEMKNTGSCSRGDACHMTHSLYEYWLHPQRYRTKMCKDARRCNRPFCFFAHDESEIRAPTAAPQPLASYADTIAEPGSEGSSSMAAAVAAAAAEASSPLHMSHVPVPPTPSKHAGTAVQQALLRQLSPPPQQLQQQVLGLSLDNSTSSLLRGFSDVFDSAQLFPLLQMGDTGASCSMNYSISDPVDGSCSTSNSNNNDVLSMMELPPCLACPCTARNSLDSSGGSPLPAAFLADSVSPVPPLLLQGGIGGAMLGQQQQQQQQQQFLPVAGASGSMYQQQQQQQQQQVTSIAPAALSAMLQRMTVTPPDMQQLQLQVPVSQSAQPALGQTAALILHHRQQQQQQQQALFVPQQQRQQQDILQVASASPVSPLASSGLVYVTATGVQPQLLVMPVAAGAGSRVVPVGSPSGLQQLQQLPTTSGISLDGLGGQQYSPQQLQW